MTLQLFRTAALFICFVLLLLLIGCSQDQPQYVKKFADRSEVPGMYTDSVTTLISDSGIIRYRVITEVWKIFDKAPEPYWYFPKKVYFERFNDSVKTESLVHADTARYYTRRKLWKLDKNVELVNLKGESFKTQQLYWDQNSHRIYSDSFIQIKQMGLTMKGYGFESNEQLTVYKIRKPVGDMPLQ